MDNIITIGNIQEYTQQLINGNLILTRIHPFVDEATLFKKDLIRSSIVECKIDNMIIGLTKFKQIQMYLYSNTDVETILQNTILNIERQAIHEKGFKYYSDLGVSIQGADARRTLKEIINITKIKKYNMELKIKLQNDEIICFVV